MKSAEHIKAQLIDYYIAKFPNDLYIGNEVMYGSKRKLVDLLILKGNSLTALEIKSEKDDLRRLHEQIIEYRKIFDYIIICTTMEHLDNVRLLSNDIGIYVIDKQKICLIRKPLKQKDKNKSEILFTINSSYLKKHMSIKKYRIDSDEIRKDYEKKDIRFINDLFVAYLKQKIEPKFNLFKEQRGGFTLIDDISLLSSSIYFG